MFNSYSTTLTPSVNPGSPLLLRGGRVSDSFLEGESTWSPFISAAPWVLLDWLQHGAKVQLTWKANAEYTLVKHFISLVTEKRNLLCKWIESDFGSFIFQLWRGRECKQGLQCLAWAFERCCPSDSTESTKDIKNSLECDLFFRANCCDNFLYWSCDWPTLCTNIKDMNKRKSKESHSYQGETVSEAAFLQLFWVML